MIDQVTEIWWPEVLTHYNFQIIFFNIYHDGLIHKKIKKKLLGHQMININKNII